MTYKIHLCRNTAESAAKHGPKAACATNPYAGKARRNQRSSYQTIPSSHIVDFRTFATTPAAARCTHCCDAMLIIRNRQRAAKGLAPISTPFEGL